MPNNHDLELDLHESDLELDIGTVLDLNLHFNLDFDLDPDLNLDLTYKLTLTSPTTLCSYCTQEENFCTYSSTLGYLV